MPPGGVLPTCTIRATAATYASVDAPLPTPLVIATAAPYQDRVANIALVDDPDVLMGTMYWKDAADGTPVFIDAGNVDAPGAIVKFGARETTDPDGTGPDDPTAPDPSSDTADLHTTTAAGTGFWSFPGVRQVFGAATYTFTHATTVTGSFDLSINEAGRTITASAGLAEAVVDDGNLDIVVLPQPGQITGSVSIVTIRNPAPFGDALISATPPGAPAVDVPVGASGIYTFPAAAGTWNLALSSTPTGNLEPDVGQTAQEVFVDAAEVTATAAHRQYVELGQVVVDFTDGSSAPVPAYVDGGVTYPRMNIALSPVTPPIFPPYPAWTDRTETADAGGRATAQRLAVSSALPTNFSVDYQITFEMPGYELDRATWQVFNEADVVVDSGTGTPVIAAKIFAGTRLRVEISAAQFGSISGSVRGLLHPPSTAPADVEDLDLADQLTVTAQQVQDAAGTQFVPPSPVNTAPTRTAGPPPGFSFSVRAGFYLLTYSHPDFVTRTQVVQVLEGAPTPASIDLEIARGSFELTVTTDEVSDGPVDLASVRLWPAGTPIGSIGTITPSYEGVTNAAGFIDFDPVNGTGPVFPAGAGPGIIPGSYLVVVRKADATNPARDTNFPVIATVSVPRGGTPALRTVAKHAVSPRTDGGITGTVLATNGFRPVNLPPFTITRSFTVPQATGPDALPNTATEADQQRLAQQATRPFPTPTGSSQGYSFAELAAGVHTLTFTAADGFTAPPAIPVTVDGVSAEPAPDATYVANSVEVRITLTGLIGTGLHPGVGVSMTSPAGGAALTSTEDPDAPGTWVFNAVLPEIGNHTITITAAHYRVDNAAQLSFEVPPSAVPVTHSVTVTPFSIINGTATKRLTATTTGPVTETNSVQLIRVSNGSVVATTTPSASGGYTFNVDVVEALRVRVTVATFKQGLVNVPTFTLAQTVNAPTAFIDKLATAAITVAGAPVSTASVVPTPATGVTVTESPPGVFQVAGLDPAVGYTFAVSAPGFLTQTYPLTGTLTSVIGGNTNATVTLETPKSISGQTFKLTTGTASTVSLFEGATLVAGPTATSGTGTYSFTGLDYGTYTVRAVANGVGAGELPDIDVEVGVASPTLQNVTMLARPLTVQFTVTPGAAVPTITINGATGTAGQTSFTFPEDGNRVFTITAPGYVPDSGTAAIPGGWDGVATVTVPRTLTAIVVTGDVAGPGSNFPATVFGCDGAVTVPATCAASPTSDGVTAANRTFSFSPVVAGTYKLVARNGAGVFTPMITVTVTAAGVVTPSPLVLTFP